MNGADFKMYFSIYYYTLQTHKFDMMNATECVIEFGVGHMLSDMLVIN